MNDSGRPERGNFIRQIIDRDIADGLPAGAVQTRFPPEPNGYLHIGHAKSICLNFGIARDYGGRCNLRFDDTNPHKENVEFVEAIQTDVRWLGFDWQDRLYFASDYFEQLHDFAVELIRKELAYVCDLSAEQIREYRGTLTEPGRDSPSRGRGVAENLELFARMRAGEFADGSHTLRARIDMAAPNLNLRDPVIYRIRHGVIHHQTGAEWCIYPMYDFTHCLSDAIEGITHSLCTLEFEDHRALYDWFIDNLEVPSRPRQYEFSRLILQYAVVSKRKLTRLVEEQKVDGWDDPRMPTLAGLRRRGVPAAAVRDFCQRIGVTKAENSIEMGLLDSCIRDQLDRQAPRAMTVLRPLKVVLSNYAESGHEMLTAPNHPKDESLGQRSLCLSREIFIDRDDFREEANKKYKRLVSGGAVRLRYGYVIRCEEVIKNPAGEIVELRCQYYPDSLAENPADLKVRGVIHWVDAVSSIPIEARLYDRLFSTPFPDREEDIMAALNPASLEVVHGCRGEAALAGSAAGAVYQFEREGYFAYDAAESQRCGHSIFNRTTTLRDNWARQADAKA